MFLALAILLAIVYVISLVLVPTVPFLLHLLIVFAIISFVLHLVRGRRV